MSTDVPALSRRVAADRAAIDQEMRTVTGAGDRPIRLARFGSGTPVVCLPMITELNFVYYPHAEALADRHEVVLYEPALSRAGRISVADRARELRAVLDILDEPAHLLAWSDAGSAAYYAGLRWPELLRSVAFLGLADNYVFPQPLQAFAQSLDKWPLDKLLPTAALRLLLSHYLSGPRVPFRWVHAETGKIPQLRALFRHSILPCMLDHRPSAADDFTVPSLFLGGDRDTLVSTRQMKAMARHLGCEFTLIPGGEHFLGYADPDAVNLALSEFYAATPAVRDRR